VLIDCGMRGISFGGTRTAFGPNPGGGIIVLRVNACMILERAPIVKPSSFSCCSLRPWSAWWSISSSSRLRWTCAFTVTFRFDSHATRLAVMSTTSTLALDSPQTSSSFGLRINRGGSQGEIGDVPPTCCPLSEPVCCLLPPVFCLLCAVCCVKHPV
jgi:hypothetical protein